MKFLMKYGFLILLVLTSCKTSRDIKDDRPTSSALDSSGIKTLDAPPASELGGGTPAQRASVEELQMKLAVSHGEVENLRYQLQQQSLKEQESLKDIKAENERLKEALNTLQSRAAVPAVASPTASSGGNVVDSLWAQGISLIKQGKDGAALVAMTTILDSYPKSNHVWGATLTSGMIQYRMKKFKGAALRFNEAIDLSAKRSRGVSLPWYFQGLTFYQLGKKEDAELFWDELNRKYPGSLVNKKLQALKKRGKFKLPDDPFEDIPTWEAFVD